MAGEAAPRHSDLHHYLNVAWRWKWLLAGLIVLIPAGVYAVSSQLGKTYEAKTTLFVQSTSVASPQFSDQTAVSTSSPDNVALLVKTPLVADLAAQKLGETRSDARPLLAQVSAALNANITTGSDTNFLTITASDSNPRRAAAIANAFAHALVAKRASQAQQAIASTLRQINANAPAISGLGAAAKQDLATQIQSLQTLRSTQQGATQIVDPVQTPTSPVSPRPLRNTALGFIFAVLLAAGLLPILDRLDRKIREADELEPLVGAPLLAMVPDQAAPGQAPGPAVQEAFQTLRASLTYYNVDRPLDILLVSSAAHSEGKTTVATNLSTALAQDGKDVVLVDADMRKPQAAARLGVEAPIGLDAVLMANRNASEALVEVGGIEGGRLRVLAAGPPTPNPSVLLGSQRMSALLDELSEQSDVIVVDTPPVLSVSDAMPLVELSTGVVFVARVNYSTRQAVERARDVITRTGGRILGVAVTGTKSFGLYDYGVYGDAGQLGKSDLAPSPEDGAESLNGGNGAGRGLLGRRSKAKATPES